MNRTLACQILGVTSKDSLDEIKKQYRLRILKYHPDKNPSPEAADKFRETKAAYDILSSSYSQEEDDPIPSYEEVLKSVLSNLFDDANESITSKIAKVLLNKLIRHCNTNLSTYLRKIDKRVLTVIHTILAKYQDAFHIPAEFLQSIHSILEEDDRPECILLNPSLDDLFSENVYRLKYKDTAYLVPLWHHDMVYDCSGSDLHVKCFPILPDNVEIDEWNNMYVYLEYDVLSLFEKVKTRERVEVEIGTRTFSFCPKELRLTDEPQEIECCDTGIPHIHVKNMFDVSVKQKVFLVVHMKF
jgi:hypothetical protein